MNSSSKDYDEEKLKEALEAIDIIEIMENEYNVAFTSQNSKGEFTALCPLPGHDEKTPSFHANIHKGVFKCWGCTEGGNIIQFIQKMESIDFISAVKRLAEITGENFAETLPLNQKNIKNIRKAINEYLTREWTSALPGGLSIEEFLFLVAERLHAYETIAKDYSFVDETYKAFDTALMAKNYKKAAQLWDALGQKIQKRKQEINYEQHLEES